MTESLSWLIKLLLTASGFVYVASARADLILNIGDTTSTAYSSTNSGVITGSFATNGNGAIANFAYNVSNGELFLLTTGGLQKRDASGTITTIAPFNYPSGSDIAVRNDGQLYVNYGDTSATVYIANSAGATTGAFNTLGNAAVTDMALNQATSDLFLLTSSGLQKRDATGLLSTIAPFSYPANSDIAVSSDGTIFVNYADSSSTVFIADATGSTIGSFNAMNGGLVRDFTFDYSSGDLFLLTSVGLQRRDPTGALSTLSSFSFPTGSSIAAYSSVTSVPEPSSALMVLLAMVGLAARSKRRMRITKA